MNHTSSTSRNRAYYFEPIGNREWSTEGNSSWTAVPGSSNTKGGTQTNHDSNTVNEYTSVGGTTFDYDPDGNLEDDGGSSYHPKYDGNGNIWQWISGGSVVEKYEYDAFGKITNSGTFSMPLRFSSKFYDEETGLYYYGYRYLDPVTGRWISRDPNEEEGAPCKNPQAHLPE